jgi:DNA-binding MarR family transcriptional regulator
MTDELVGMCRFFGVFEREAVCCGTVTVPQCVVLQKLLEGAEQDVSGLAAFVGVTNGAMTRLLDGLERRGFVERVRDTDDRRRVTIELTRSGREEASRLRRLTEAAVGAVLARIPKSKHAQILESARLVRTAMEAARTELAACCG